MRRILRSVTWFEHEKGQITESECYSQLTAEFSLSSDDIASGLRAMREATQEDPSIISILRELKDRTGLRIFAMSNISPSDWDALVPRRTPKDWALFDRVFTSFAAEERKPNLGYYRHVLDAAAVDPLRTIFVDRDIENVVSAKSLGMRGIVLTTAEELEHVVRPLLRDPVEDGKRWLSENAKKMWSVTDTGVAIAENFSQLLLLEITQDWTLVDVMRTPGRSNFFRGELDSCG